MKTISIIIPCFNEEEVILLFYQEVTNTLKTIDDIHYELIFINDGSKDHTLDILKSLSRNDSHCIWYSFSRNFGKEAAMYAGLSYAKGDYCVFMDADLQHPPKLLKDMYYALSKEGYDCCAGFRQDRNGEGKIRSFLSHHFYRIISKLCELDMNDGAGDFRMMNRIMVDSILEMKEYNRYMKGIFSFVGFETKWIPFHNVERAAGKTKWNLHNLFSYALEGILSFSTAPLLLSAVFSMICLVAAFLMIIYILISIFNQQYISELFIMITVLLFVSGLQMLFVALLGQYLSKDYLENKRRPIYIVKESSQNIY